MSSDTNTSNLSGYYPSQDIFKILDGRITQLINVKPLNIKGRSFLLCDSDYAYGTIKFISAGKRIKRGDVNTLANEIGLTQDSLDGMWPKRRQYYTYSFELTRFPRKKPISRLTHDGPISPVTDIVSKRNVFVDAMNAEDVDKISKYPLKIRIVEMD